MEEIKLKKEVGDKYNPVGVPHVGMIHYEGFGKIDLAEVDLERADALVRRQFPHLVSKDKKEIAPAAETSKSK